MSASASDSVPAHVAIIMDGNGRWAKKQKMPRTFGHQAGRETVREVMTLSAQLGVSVLSLFAFSTENWRRPRHEVGLLMHLMLKTIAEEVETMVEKGIRFRMLGNRLGLSAELVAAIERAEDLTRACETMQVVLALNYSGRWAITETAKTLAKAVKRGELEIESIDEQAFAAARPIADLPAVDLLIRSSGEMRLSNFYLWEMAYAELYFTDTLWPDFAEADFKQALAVYATRERRFGALTQRG